MILTKTHDIRDLVAAPESRLARAFATLTVWRHRIRTRRHLAQLNDHLLGDIGIDRIAADRESEKRFWQS
ncbi:MAG: DUF1127 domain-containing protein [Pseudomonadota bacterium]